MRYCSMLDLIQAMRQYDPNDQFRKDEKDEKGGQEEPRLPTAKTSKVGAVKSGHKRNWRPRFIQARQVILLQISGAMLNNAKHWRPWHWLGTKV